MEADEYFEMMSDFVNAHAYGDTHMPTYGADEDMISFVNGRGGDIKSFTDEQGMELFAALRHTAGPVAQASALAQDALMTFITQTIRNARELGYIGDIVVAMHAPDPALIERITVEAGGVIGDARVLSVPYTFSPAPVMERKRIIYIGITNDAIAAADFYSNNMHLRNINAYGVDYYGFTFAPSDRTVPIYFPTNEKSPPQWYVTGTSSLWFEGEVAEEARRGAPIVMTLAGLNYAMLNAVVASL